MDGKSLDQKQKSRYKQALFDKWMQMHFYKNTECIKRIIYYFLIIKEEKSMDHGYLERFEFDYESDASGSFLIVNADADEKAYISD